MRSKGPVLRQTWSACDASQQGQYHGSDPRAAAPVLLAHALACVSFLESPLIRRGGADADRCTHAHSSKVHSFPNSNATIASSSAYRVAIVEAKVIMAERACELEFKSITTPIGSPSASGKLNGFQNKLRMPHATLKRPSGAANKPARAQDGPAGSQK